MAKKKEKSLTTNNIHQQRQVHQQSRLEKVMKESRSSQGEIDGKLVNWHYAEGKAE